MAFHAAVSIRTHTVQVLCACNEAQQQCFEPAILVCCAVRQPSGNVVLDLQNAENVTGLTCTVTLNVEKDMPGPIYVWYELNGFYQNHRRYGLRKRGVTWWTCSAQGLCLGTPRYQACLV